MQRFRTRTNKEKPSLFSRIKQKALPYLFGATVGLFGGCGDDGSGGSGGPAPITTGPEKTDVQGEVDINDTSGNAYHIIVRDEKTLELLANIDIYTVNHSIEIPAIDGLKDYIAELRILPSEPQTLEVLMSKVTDRVSDNLPEYKTWFHPESINWSGGTEKINTEPIPMSELADFYETYESDAIVNLLQILPDLWGINTFAQSAGFFRDKVIENVSNISQILGLNPDEIFYDIYRENRTGMLYHVRVDGISVSNTRPIVEMPYLRGTFSGNITIPYNLKDTELDLCNLLVEYSKDDLTFFTATQGIGSDGITNLTSSLTGTNHIFVWDSKVDNLGLTLEEIVKLRIIPSDAGGNGQKGERSISINNNLQKIVFYSDRDGNREIYIMNADGTEQTRLTNNSAYDKFPSLSPDGNKIAFITERDGNSEIYSMNSDGTNQINLTNNPTPDEYPSWSHDGTKIAFNSTRGGNTEIYVMNSDGSGLVRLTNNSYYDYRPTWSPDGTKIAFASSKDGNYEIYVMNSDGTNQINLTNNSANDYKPTWSPDGTKIVFYSDRDGNNEIYVMNANGTNQTNLTNNPAWDEYPSWSPDGTKIMFTSLRDGNSEIYSMNSDGTNQINLTNNPALDVGPSYSP